MKVIHRPLLYQQHSLLLRFVLRPSPVAPLRLLHTSAPFRKAEVSDNTPPLTARPEAASSPIAAPPNPRPVNAPKPVIDIKHIRQNAELHSQNCLDRNYHAQAAYPAEIQRLFAQWTDHQNSSRSLRQRANLLRKQLGNPATTQGDQDPAVEELRHLSRDQVLEELKDIKQRLQATEDAESELQSKMEALALAMPNMTSEETPRSGEGAVLTYINDHPEPTPSSSDRIWRSHVHIGAELGLLDFAASGTSSGWGWYYLLGDAAQLEQALVQFALKTVTSTSSHEHDHNWVQVSPPGVVYSHIAAACGFQPRDQNGETQIYTLSQSAKDAARGVPELCLAGTAEIPLAAMFADAEILEQNLPLKRVAVSRCYRAEAGARGVDTKGLYRVHEFTKVEMFAWTSPSWGAVTEVFDEMVDLQTEMLQTLGLHCRVLEMPTTDLGASAARKVDIEAFFPSRRDRHDGWGEVTSASICTDYQARRLGTRTKFNGSVTFPWTVNGTALAVPRVLAAILENGWDENNMVVKVPEVLRPYMGGKSEIGMKHMLR